jgi:uncharacterized protein
MPRPSVVLDTNVVVSAHLNADGFERFALDLALARKLRLYLSLQILEEYESVLLRKKFGFNPKLVKASLDLIKKSSTKVNPPQGVDATPDPEDNKFLECAAEAEADYLVIGNKHHFPKRYGRTHMVNARELLENLIPQLRG